MLWVLKRTISERWFFRAPTTSEYLTDTPHPLIPMSGKSGWFSFPAKIQKTEKTKILIALWTAQTLGTLRAAG